MKLYELANEYQELARLAADAGDPAEAQAFTDTLEGLGGMLEQKILNCAAVCKTLEAEENAIDEERKRLTARADAIAHARTRMKAYMQSAMEAADKDKIKGELFTVSIQNNPPRVKLEEGATIPEQYQKVTVTPMLSEIGKALKDGAVIAGAHLEYSKGLRIR
jgi:hypothetical protein